MEPKKSLGFTLFVDEDINQLFTFMFNLYGVFEESIANDDSVRNDPQAVNMRETFQRLLDSMIDPSHELGWCKDPECEWTPKNKKHSSNK